MVGKLYRLVAAIALIAVSLYIVILNRDVINLNLGPSYQISTSAGVIFIGIFCTGVLATALVAALFGFRLYLKERGLLGRERQRQAFFESMLQARGALASGDSERAKELWRDIIRKEPNNIIARVELSRALEASGETREALKVLDAARSTSSSQPLQHLEVLMRAAELNMSLGNRTAAIDNLALILYHQPAKTVAALARDLSEEIGRLEDALEYHARVEKIGPPDPDSEQILLRLSMKRLIRDCGEDSNRLLEELRAFVKKHPSYGPALAELADRERKNGDIESAAQLLIKAAKLGGDFSLWRKAIELWSSAGLPDRAIATARSAAKELTGQAMGEAELELARLYISLHMFDEAEDTLKGFDRSARTSPSARPEGLILERHMLEGLCLNAMGSFRESSEIWKRLLDARQGSVKAAQALELRHPVNGHAPAPRLSTP